MIALANGCSCSELTVHPKNWNTKAASLFQNDLYAMMEDFRVKKNLKRKDLADILNVSQSYISQILNEDFDHKLSKMLALSMVCNNVPVITYEDLEHVIKNDEDRCAALFTHRPSRSSWQSDFTVNPPHHVTADTFTTPEFAKIIRLANNSSTLTANSARRSIA